MYVKHCYCNSINKGILLVLIFLLSFTSMGKLNARAYSDYHSLYGYISEGNFGYSKDMDFLII